MFLKFTYWGQDFATEHVSALRHLTPKSNGANKETL